VSKHKEFRVFHWDTFSGGTILLDSFSTWTEAYDFIKDRYKGRIGGGGADKVEIVNDLGVVIDSYPVR